MILIYILISAMPLILHPFWSEFSIGLTMIKYLGMACVAYAFLYHMSRTTSPRFFETKQAWFFSIYAVAAMVSYVTIGAPIAFDSSQFLNAVSFFFLFYTIVSVVDSMQQLRRILIAMVAAIALASLYVLREWQKGGFGNTRPGWVTGDPNYFAISALLIMPVALYLALGDESRRVRLFCWVALCMTLLSVILGASRGGFLGLVASVIFLILRGGRRGRKLTMLIVIFALIAVVSPISPYQRLTERGSSEINGEEARLVLWAAGLNAIEARPWFGLGVGNYKAMVALFGDPDDPTLGNYIAHNTYIEVAAELGIPVFLAFVAAIGCAFLTLGRARRRQRDRHAASPQLGDLALAMQTGLVSFAVSSFFVSAYWSKFMWLFVFLSMCFPQIERAVDQAAAEAAEPRTPATARRAVTRT
jgi:O-antigen ligase